MVEHENNHNHSEDQTLVPLDVVFDAINKSPALIAAQKSSLLSSLSRYTTSTELTKESTDIETETSSPSQDALNRLENMLQIKSNGEEITGERWENVIYRVSDALGAEDKIKTWLKAQEEELEIKEYKDEEYDLRERIKEVIEKLEEKSKKDKTDTIYDVVDTVLRLLNLKVDDLTPLERHQLMYDLRDSLDDRSIEL